jgi:anthranilate synthase component 2
MILLLDNYDSFTYNLLHYLEQVTDEVVEVRRNDGLTIAEVSRYSSVVLSPGPGLPESAGIMMDLIATYKADKPILGICLGLQAIGQVFGGQLKNLESVLHGVQRKVNILNNNDRLFTGIPAQISTGHYHSWVVAAEGLSPEMEITVTDDAGNIMALSHRRFPLSGVQFHPESIMTDSGLKII